MARQRRRPTTDERHKLMLRPLTLASAQAKDATIFKEPLLERANQGVSRARLGATLCALRAEQ